ncbi:MULTISPECIES: hypothetical protein [unclassified Streptomyces]|uniref:hypothetical protein n=1 Tax=unclassified Streptomyces TaxID=2593676 RepID=UPI0038253B2A
METTSQVAGQPAQGAPRGARSTPEGVSAAWRTLDGYLRAPFPWYGLDAAFTGPRWLMQVALDADGTVEHGSVGHGDEPSIRPDAPDRSGADRDRFAVVVTIPANPVRRSGDGTGVLEATSVSSAAWLAGSGLLSFTWPAQMDHVRRGNWLDQQTEAAWELADDLESADWSSLSLPVDGVPTDFRYRESEFGWVLAGSAESGVHLGAYGRGLSAYGLAFSVVMDIASYA